jgi:hypothetical protein
VRIVRITLGLAGLAALCLAALVALDGTAGAVPPGASRDAVHTPKLAMPVKVWRDCQEIAFCEGCKPRYKCRSCTYQKACSRGYCEWRDVCVWSPFMKVLPPGARIIRIR